jgi:hypothetical protein
MSEPANPEGCPVCKTGAPWTNKGGGGWGINCRRCGTFDIGWIATEGLGQFSVIQRANLSGWIRENQGCVIGSADLKSLSQLETPSVGEKADKLLLCLARNYQRPGEVIELFKDGSLELQAASWAADDKELRYLMREYLFEAAEFLLLTEHRTGLGSDEFYKISPQGWVHLDSLRQGNIQSQIGFIAMWFNESVSEAWKAIDQGIRGAGYYALRIDQKQHNNKIDDEIVAGIRRSKFLVADFTGQRGGVYFEAGLAMGLGLPVIWLCRQDHLKETHFDTRQYNFIVWEADKLDKLSEALEHRIEATIGRGPFQRNT